MINLLVELLVLIIIFGLLYWLVLMLPPPFRVIGSVVLAFLMIVVLLGLVGWVPGWHLSAPLSRAR